MCDCIDQINTALDKRKMKLTQELVMRDGQIVMSGVVVATEFLKGKQIPPPLFATYCPFCGEKYPEVKHA